MKESVFSFFDCIPAPQGPHFTVLPDMSDRSDKSDYTVVAGAARDFCGRITAYAVIRSAERAFRRVVCEAKTLFNRRVFILQGGVRLWQPSFISHHSSLSKTKQELTALFFRVAGSCFAFESTNYTIKQQ